MTRDLCDDVRDLARGRSVVPPDDDNDDGEDGHEPPIPPRRLRGVPKLPPDPDVLAHDLPSTP